MDALQAYTSDFSGAESDGSGEEQPKSVAAEAAEDVETIAEQRLFQLGGSEVGVLSFLMSCPPLTKLKICRNSIVAADLEEACGGRTVGPSTIILRAVSLSYIVEPSMTRSKLAPSTLTPSAGRNRPLPPALMSDCRMLIWQNCSF